MAQELEQDASLLQDYLTECDELLQNLDRDLVALESSPDDKELLNSIFRAFHTVKGTSGFLGFTHIVELTHHAEDVLNVLRKGECEVTRSTTDALLATLDQLREMLGDVRTGGQHTYEIRHLLRDLHSSIPEDVGNSPIATPAAASVSAKPADAGMVHQNDGRLSAPSASAPPGEISSRRSAAAAETARTIRVDVAKLDELINLVGELVLERNRLQHLSRTFSGRQTAATDDFESALLHSTERLSFITDELQTAGLSTRMVSVEAIFRRFPRMVRDLAASLGKQVELVIRGEETELDKTIAEEIADPLIHLLRNSLDHGIERPQVRVERGKSPKGTVRVEARPEGDNVIIEIADDGAGMDVARVAKKALEKGLVTQDQLAAMSSREILDLIFLPGFSTAEQVSDVSGRGVGMDVVRSNIKKLNGTVELESELGRGLCIQLRLPLTLAILPVLLVAVDRETYALPLRAVVETIRVNASDIHRANHVHMLRLRDRVLPVCWLQQAVGLPAKSRAERQLLRVVVLAAGEKRVGLVVDQLVGQEETVIKPISSHLRHIQGLSGATISGDGEVRLILDPAGIIQLIEEHTTKGELNPVPTQSVSVREQTVSAEELRDPALVKIRDLIYRTSGIFQPENKFYLLANRCQRRMKVLGSGSFGDYLDQLNSRATRDTEMRSLLNEITIGETCFFRNQPQIDAVTKIILPKLVAMKSKLAYKKIRMWSAGCSTGEEPYTLALLMSEQVAQKLRGWTFEVMATDLNDNSLVKCREGLYSEYALRNTSPQLRDKYFTQQGDLFRVRDEVRANIKFDRLNLQDQSRILFMKGFDIIFCCNVLIYFDATSKKRTVEHFHSGLLPGGHFFLGHSESLYGISEQFRLVHFPNATAYLKPAPGEPAGGAQ